MPVPVPPPAGQLLIRVVPPSLRFPGYLQRAAYLDELEAVPLVTIVALFPAFRQGLVSKLLQPWFCIDYKALSTRHLAFDRAEKRRLAEC